MDEEGRRDGGGAGQRAAEVSSAVLLKDGGRPWGDAGGPSFRQVEPNPAGLFPHDPCATTTQHALKHTTQLGEIQSTVYLETENVYIAYIKKRV